MRDGWTAQPFENCIESVSYTRKVQRKDFLNVGAFPVVSQEESFINGYWDNEADVFKAPTPVVLFGDHTKVLKYVNFDFVLGADGVKILKPRKFLAPKFFFYQLKAAGLPSLGYARHYRLLRGLRIAYPPLPEQLRIVAVLDEAFAAISRACANSEQNLRNGRALFESRLNGVFAQGGDGWGEMKLASICEVFADGDWIESKDQSPEGIRLVQTGNVGLGVFKSRGEKARYVSEETFRRLRCTEIFEGDCLISRLPDPVGRSCLLPNTGERMITAVDCTIARFKRDTVVPEFFELYAQSQMYLKNVDFQTSGTTRKRISRSRLAQVLIPIPPLPEQRAIVGTLSEMSVETLHIGSIYEQKLAALDALKQSLLHQAFPGPL